MYARTRSAKKELNIILIGVTASGKSSLINFIDLWGKGI